MPKGYSKDSEGPFDRALDVPMRCLSCGKYAVERLGDLRSTGTFKCGTCGASHDLAVEPWPSYIAQVDSAFDVLNQALEQLGTNIKHVR
jgi:DNA-directed RNA polymerase subunit N (RpoN/RPB10)